MDSIPCSPVPSASSCLHRSGHATADAPHGTRRRTLQTRRRWRAARIARSCSWIADWLWPTCAIRCGPRDQRNSSRRVLIVCCCCGCCEDRCGRRSLSAAPPRGPTASDQGESGARTHRATTRVQWSGSEVRGECTGDATRASGSADRYCAVIQRGLAAQRGKVGQYR